MPSAADSFKGAIKVWFLLHVNVTFQALCRLLLAVGLLFLAHLSRRLTGELIVYQSSRRPCVRACVGASVHTFKHEYLCNQLADLNEILSKASLGWGKGFSRF